jgi:hypothetical protein
VVSRADPKRGNYAPQAPDPVAPGCRISGFEDEFEVIKVNGGAHEFAVAIARAVRFPGRTFGSV